jgi:transposase
VDTIGLLMAVVVVAANTSDNVGGTAVMEPGVPKSGRLTKLWHDAGFKRAVAKFCRSQKVKAELVSRTNAHTFEVLPRRWVVERTWAGPFITDASASTMNATRS